MLCIPIGVALIRMSAEERRRDSVSACLIAESMSIPFFLSRVTNLISAPARRSAAAAPLAAPPCPRTTTCAPLSPAPVSLSAFIKPSPSVLCPIKVLPLLLIVTMFTEPHSAAVSSIPSSSGIIAFLYGIVTANPLSERSDTIERMRHNSDSATRIFKKTALMPNCPNMGAYISGERLCSIGSPMTA